MGKFLKNTVKIISGIAAVLIMAVSAVEIAAYSDYGFYEKEYEKYNVNNPSGIVNTATEELVDVTRDMMAYLRGDREDMVIYAVIDGTEKEVFNNIEKFHMADVRNLFIKGLNVRRISIGITITGMASLILLYGWKRGLREMMSGMKNVILAVWVLLFIVAVAAAINFTAVFTVFHMIFFDNDGWLLDPQISRLINMLPEGFFVDMAIRIGVIYILLNFIIIAFAFWVKRGKMFSYVKNNKIGGTYEQG